MSYIYFGIFVSILIDRYDVKVFKLSDYILNVVYILIIYIFKNKFIFRFNIELNKK